jgi:hypothetical protein
MPSAGFSLLPLAFPSNSWYKKKSARSLGAFTARIFQTQSIFLIPERLVVRSISPELIFARLPSPILRREPASSLFPASALLAHAAPFRYSRSDGRYLFSVAFL